MPPSLTDCRLEVDGIVTADENSRSTNAVQWVDDEDERETKSFIEEHHILSSDGSQLSDYGRYIACAEDGESLGWKIVTSSEIDGRPWSHGHTAVEQ